MKSLLIILLLCFVVENSVGQINYHLVIWDEEHEEIDIRKPIPKNKKVEIESATYEADIYNNRFKIVEMEVLHFRGKEEINRIRFDNGHLDLSKFDAKCGDGFSVKLIAVEKTEEGASEILQLESLENADKFVIVFICK